MAKKYTTTDREPGPPPEIRAKGDSITFVFHLSDVVNAGSQAELLLRCETNDEIWVSIVPVCESD
jgi:hypothetical protein